MTRRPDIRAVLGWLDETQKEFGRRFATSQTTVGRWAQGNLAPPTEVEDLISRVVLEIASFARKLESGRDRSQGAHAGDRQSVNTAPRVVAEPTLGALALDVRRHENEAQALLDQSTADFLDALALANENRLREATSTLRAGLARVHAARRLLTDAITISIPSTEASAAGNEAALRRDESHALQQSLGSGRPPSSPA